MRRYKKLKEEFKIVNTKAIQLNSTSLLLGEDRGKEVFYIKNKYGIVGYTKNEIEEIYGNMPDFDLLKKI